MAQNKSEIINGIKHELTGQKALDLPIIDDYLKKYADNQLILSKEQKILNSEIIKELVNLRMSYFSKEEIATRIKEQKAKADKMMAEFNQAVKFTKEKKHNLAMPLLTKITMKYQKNQVRAYDFPNLMEYILYLESPTNETKIKIMRTTEPVCLCYYYLGINHLGLGQVDEAITCFTQSLEYNPRSINCMIELAGIYLKKNQFELAYERLKQSLELAYMPEHLSLIYHLFGQYYYNNVQYKIANACYLVSIHYDSNLKLNYSAIKQIEDTIGEVYDFPSSEDYRNIFAQYNLQFGPSSYVINILNAFINDAMQKKSLGSARYFLQTAYELTKSPIYENELKHLNNIMIQNQK